MIRRLLSRVEPVLTVDSVELEPSIRREAAPIMATMPMHRPFLGVRFAILRDIVEVVLVVLSIYTLVNLASARAIVEGSSMQPSFETGQLIIVNRFAYFYSQPERGDVVVLHNPRNVEEDYIKRVIGLPGENVAIIGGVVHINGVKLTETYLSASRVCHTVCDGSWSLGADEYFVLGDNRRNSTDSHVFGPVRRDLIIGKAWVRYWPLDTLGVIPHEDYQDGSAWLGVAQPARPAGTATPAPRLPSRPREAGDA
jgi:signal peptidase I